MPAPPAHQIHNASVLSLCLPAGADLYGELVEFVRREKIQAAWVTAGIGGLGNLVVRTAAAQQPTHFAGPWELVSLQGNLCPDGVHLHMTASDAGGRCRGGHLIPGNRLRTSAELALMLPEGAAFRRVLDTTTGDQELVLGER